MKKLFVCILIACPYVLFAQASSSDSTGVREACKNYVEGYYTADSARVSKGVHPELVKRIVTKMNNEYRIRNMSGSELVMATSHSKTPDKNPQEPFKISVIIYDISQDVACAKIVTNKMQFFDYVQLAKFNNEWKVVNVLWAFTR